MNLDEIYQHIWKSIRVGAGPTRSPFTIWQLATLGLDGSPQIRSIVLRSADEDARLLSFHTDRRSAKIKEIEADPRVSLVSLDLQNYAQLRVSGVAVLSQDQNEMQRLWAEAKPHTLILYQAPLAPATVIDSPGQGQVQQASKTSGFENFALIQIQVSKIEYLDITPGNHQRALFTCVGGRWAEQWLAP